MRITNANNANYQPKVNFGKMVFDKSSSNIIQNMTSKEQKALMNYKSELKNTKFYDLEVHSYQPNTLFIKMIDKQNKKAPISLPFYDITQKDSTSVIGSTIDLYDPDPFDETCELMTFKNKERANEVFADLKNAKEEYLIDKSQFKLLEWAIKCIKYLEESKSNKSL